MSQQINLILPELRPRFDWLGFPVVVIASLLALLLVACVFSWQQLQVARLQAEEVAIKGQLDSLQVQLQALGQAIGARRGDPKLPEAIAEQRTGNAERKNVLDLLAKGAAGNESGYVGAFQGFSRQTLDGLWLTGFALASDGFEIHGALLEPSLLPRYIDKLNKEPAFAGRRFAALDMTGVDPAKPALPAAGAQPVVAVAATGAPQRHTLFVLRSSLQNSGEAAQ